MPTRVPSPSPTLDKSRAPMGSDILSSVGAGVWRSHSGAFPDSNSTLDKFLLRMFSVASQTIAATPPLRSV